MSNNNKTLVIVAIVAIIIFGIVAVMNMPDRRTPGEKMGDAINEMSDGVEDATESLQNRTPAEKVGDAIEDTGEAIKDKTGN